jgi:hypothetical protein
MPNGQPRRLTQTKERESSPRFLPDGSLVYVVEAGGRSKGSRVVRMVSGAAAPTPLLATDYPVLALDISPDGSRAIYVVAQPGSAKGRTEHRMFIQPLAGGAAAEITLRAAEQVVSPTF